MSRKLHCGQCAGHLPGQSGRVGRKLAILSVRVRVEAFVVSGKRFGHQESPGIDSPEGSPIS